MSRVGKNPVVVPNGVTITLNEEQISAKGKLGELNLSLTSDVTVTQEDNQIWVKPKNDSKRARALWGTTRANISNLVSGVSEGFTKKLEITGVGYRAQVQGNKLVLQLGFSHDVEMEIPTGLSVVAEKPTLVAISGADKQLVGQFAANARGWRGPEPYKGKGVRYEGEYILRKEGKKK
ncbi:MULTISPECIES: 50S ribosomal protein L6 [Thalassospira]|jgi:large subunit ribosomal protein L6|uniref:Large ribosomal subunit protein uL6 n=2 Tax=Thalassospira TaxID=168934 RepID=A0A358HVW0_9PROT|nr:MULTISPECIES: 50S ribosomal protein L6 [Thalassospira]MBV15882.1 50S ribosomal protein L6 [Thalassospira sp.]PKR57254.1 50S ribosomal protein L6 [Thalassospira lohafexi]RCK21142.1 50S ribosomal protein L6 [Thalassospira lucentensis MCCC 1A00383 = DSM 14000]HBU99316.1 50S ribosomal protein L6 [Thalassospira lucentensis]|tara:strand:+ start:7257 stop:7790 length:534 start_codon:yes stop_codon:yes gene_type:complete